MPAFRLFERALNVLEQRRNSGRANYVSPRNKSLLNEDRGTFMVNLGYGAVRRTVDLVLRVVVCASDPLVVCVLKAKPGENRLNGLLSSLDAAVRGEFPGNELN
jgi:hypothetical protein